MIQMTVVALYGDLDVGLEKRAGRVFDVPSASVHRKKT
jgi:hypothetical protein